MLIHWHVCSYCYYTQWKFILICVISLYPGPKWEKKYPLKLNIIIKEFLFVCFFNNKRVRRVGRYVLGMWLVLIFNNFEQLCVKSQTEEARILLSEDVSLSGWKFGAWVHSLPELRQEMYCAEKWAPCQMLPSPSSLRGGSQKVEIAGKTVKSHPGVWTPTPLRAASLTCVTRQ